MDEIKPWQIILMVLAVAAVGFIGWRTLNANNLQSSDHRMVADIVTGQLYRLEKGKARGMVLPAAHPDTGDRTLYPVELNGDEWTLEARASGTIPEDILENANALDGDRVRVLDNDPITHVLMP